MNPSSTHPRIARMDDQAPPLDPRQAYEAILVRAMGYASRMLPRAEAFEVAHDVAVEMMRRPPESRMDGPILYLAVTSRLRNTSRGVQRRAARDGKYLEIQSHGIPDWTQPGSDLEASELHAYLEAAVANMPTAMRDTFLLVREAELSYKDAAAHLGVSVGTVHTQLSRALALLRECVKQYHADAPMKAHSRNGRRP